MQKVDSGSRHDFSKNWINYQKSPTKSGKSYFGGRFFIEKISHQKTLKLAFLNLVMQKVDRIDSSYASQSSCGDCFTVGRVADISSCEYSWIALCVRMMIHGFILWSLMLQAIPSNGICQVTLKCPQILKGRYLEFVYFRHSPGKLEKLEKYLCEKI